jgi:hypothetical protein
MVPSRVSEVRLLLISPPPPGSRRSFRRAEPSRNGEERAIVTCHAEHKKLLEKGVVKGDALFVRARSRRSSSRLLFTRAAADAARA